MTALLADQGRTLQESQHFEAVELDLGAAELSLTPVRPDVRTNEDLMPHPLVLLLGAIACEVAATLNLRAASGFTRVGPTALVVLGYTACFVLLGLAFKEGLNLGVGYAIWSGAGTAIVAVASVFLFKERLTPLALVGIGLIIIGCVVSHLGGAHKEAADAPDRASDAGMTARRVVGDAS